MILQKIHKNPIKKPAFCKLRRSWMYCFIVKPSPRLHYRPSPSPELVNGLGPFYPGVIWKFVFTAGGCSGLSCAREASAGRPRKVICAMGFSPGRILVMGMVSKHILPINHEPLRGVPIAIGTTWQSPMLPTIP